MKAMLGVSNEGVVRQALAMVEARKAKAAGLEKGTKAYNEAIRQGVDAAMCNGYDDEDVAEARKMLAEAAAK